MLRLPYACGLARVAGGAVVDGFQQSEHILGVYDLSTSGSFKKFYKLFPFYVARHSVS